MGKNDFSLSGSIRFMRGFGDVPLGKFFRFQRDMLINWRATLIEIALLIFNQILFE